MVVSFGTLVMLVGVLKIARVRESMEGRPQPSPNLARTDTKWRGQWLQMRLQGTMWRLPYT